MLPKFIILFPLFPAFQLLWFECAPNAFTCSVSIALPLSCIWSFVVQFIQVRSEFPLFRFTSGLMVAMTSLRKCLKFLVISITDCFISLSNFSIFMSASIPFTSITPLLNPPVLVSIIELCLNTQSSTNSSIRFNDSLALVFRKLPPLDIN